MSELFKFYPFIGDVYRWSVFANRLLNTIIHFFSGARMLNAAQVSSGYQPCVKIQEPTSSQPWSCSCFVLKCTCDIHLRGGVCGISGVAGVLVAFGAFMFKHPRSRNILQRRATDVIQMESILVAPMRASVISRTIPQDHNKIAPVFCYCQPPPDGVFVVYGGKVYLTAHHGNSLTFSLWKALRWCW